MLCVKVKSNKMLFRVVRKRLHEVMKRDRIANVSRFDAWLFYQYQPYCGTMYLKCLLSGFDSFLAFWLRLSVLTTLAVALPALFSVMLIMCLSPKFGMPRTPCSTCQLHASRGSRCRASRSDRRLGLDIGWRRVGSCAWHGKEAASQSEQRLVCGAASFHWQFLAGDKSAVE